MNNCLPISGLLLALTSCNSSPSTSRIDAAPTRQRSAEMSSQRRPVPPATAPLSTYVPVTSSTPAVVDTLALLRRARGGHLAGYVVDQFAVGDLNQDHRPDFLVVYRNQRVARRRTGDTNTVEEGQLAIVLNQGWPQLQLAAVAPLGCLGTGCTFRGVSVKGRYFSVERLEGDCEKTYTVHTYRYAPAQRNWQLYKIGERLYSLCSYNSGEEEYHEQTRRDFGRVVFGQ
jgi:hypothetical protein